MTRRPSNLLAMTGLAGLAMPLLATGCFFQPYDGVFFEKEDVTLDVPSSDERAAYDGPHFWVGVTAEQVNGWVTDLVESSALVVKLLNQYPETEREGAWRVYGPFNDDESRDLSYLVRINGDAAETSFEIFVGKRNAKRSDMDLGLEGTLRVDGDMRDGELVLDFDTLEKHPDWKRDRTYTYQGDIGVSFTRNVETEAKTIELDFMDYRVEHESFLDDDIFTSDEAYTYVREADGSGVFHLALMGEWDNYGFSGPAAERMQLDERWDASGASRTLGEVTDEQQTGDLKHGDLTLEECHDASDMRVFRWINDEYLVEVPDYREGDETACAFATVDPDA